MSKTIQIRVDDFLKNAADDLFASLWLDTSTAIRIFLTMSIETGGLPFDVKIPNLSPKQAMDDVMNKKNLSEPYKNSKDAIASMCETCLSIFVFYIMKKGQKLTKHSSLKLKSRLVHFTKT